MWGNRKRALGFWAVWVLAAALALAGCGSDKGNNRSLSGGQPSSGDPNDSGGTGDAGDSDGTGGSGGSGVTLESLELTSTLAVLTLSAEAQVAATGHYSDGSSADLSDEVEWSTSNASVLALSGTSIEGMSVGEATISAVHSESGLTASLAITVTAATLESLSLEVETQSLPLGRYVQISAIGTFSDGTEADVTAAVDWDVSNGNASISQVGTLAGEALGGVEVTATEPGSQLSASLEITVTDAVLEALEILSEGFSLPLGVTLQLSALGHFSDGSTLDLSSAVDWASGDDLLAEVDQDGTLLGLDSGFVTISANDPDTGVEGWHEFEVTSAVLESISIVPQLLNLPNGLSQWLTAIGTFSDGSTFDLSTTVDWGVDDEQLATISSQGQLSALDLGLVTVTAVDPGTDVSGEIEISVTAAILQSILVFADELELPLGLSLQLAALGIYSDGTELDITTSVNWSKGGSVLASLSSGGLLQTLGIGDVTVSASLGDVSDQEVVSITPAVLTSIEVLANSLDLPLGLSQQLTAIGHYTGGGTLDITSLVTWSKGGSTLASLTSGGLLTALDLGGLTVSATLDEITGEEDFTVSDAVLESIEILADSLTVPLGLSLQLTAIGHYSGGAEVDITDLVTWSDGGSLFASVGADGLLESLGIGGATVTAELDSITGEEEFTVTAAILQAIEVLANELSVPLGLTQQLAAIGTYSDGSEEDITDQVDWESGNVLRASVSATGLLTSLALGQVSAIASLNGVSGNATLTMTAAILQSITVSPVGSTLTIIPIVNPNPKKQYSATGHYSDGSTANLTSSVTWNSTSPLIANFGILGGLIGQVVALLPGSTTIQATLGDITGQTGLTVTAL